MASLGERIFPWINDFALGSKVEPLRSRVVGGARGRTLELGAGTGLNFPHYPAGVEVVAVEPAEGMRKRAEERARQGGLRARVEVVEGRAGSLPFDAGSFDTVVFTFVLCSVDGLDKALGEARRVLRSGGELRLAEHVLSGDKTLARVQRWLDPAWSFALGGCRLTRDVRQELERAGFDVGEIVDVELPLPLPARAGVWGAARKL